MVEWQNEFVEGFEIFEWLTAMQVVLENGMNLELGRENAVEG
jgi:hypothetical protein